MFTVAKEDVRLKTVKSEKSADGGGRGWMVGSHKLRRTPIMSSVKTNVSVELYELTHVVK